MELLCLWFVEPQVSDETDDRMVRFRRQLHDLMNKYNAIMQSWPLNKYNAIMQSWLWVGETVKVLQIIYIKKKHNFNAIYVNLYE